MPGRGNVKNLEDVIQLLKQVSKISPSEEADGENRYGLNYVLKPSINCSIGIKLCTKSY